MKKNAEDERTELVIAAESAIASFERIESVGAKLNKHVKEHPLIGQGCDIAAFLMYVEFARKLYAEKPTKRKGVAR